MPGFELRGRHREREAFDRLLRDVRAGQSRALVLRGEAGAGKTALLDHVAQAATGCQVVRGAGVETETDIAYASLQQLCASLLGHLDRLPGPQRDALNVAFGLSQGHPPSTLILGLAVLGLFAEAAATRPLVCLVDDVQWLDQASELILTFVARRLDAESVALILAARRPDDDNIPRGLPELAVEGLPEAEARELLASVVPGPLDARIGDRIIAETGGNPLALLELHRGLSHADLALGFGGYRRTPVAGQVEEDFQRRIAALPADTRQVLLAAAVEPTGNVPLLLRALEELGVGLGAVAEAEAAGLIAIRGRVLFRHPLARSAAWRSADAAALRSAHAALAEVTDSVEDPDRRAWHRAHAVAGPDEEVAAELARVADRARGRGGLAAAATFLERAAELTLDPDRRVTLLLDTAQARLESGMSASVPDLLAAAAMAPLEPPRLARLEQLRARLTFSLQPTKAVAESLRASAKRLESLDLDAARRTHLLALGATLHTGRLGGADLRRDAHAARRLPPGEDFAGLLLTGLTAWALDGFRAAQPLLDRALKAHTVDDDPDLLFLVAPVAQDLQQVATAYRTTAEAVRYARATGAASLLPTALSYRAGTLLFMGRFADAAGLLDEGMAVSQATGTKFPPFARLAMVAMQGHAEQTLAQSDAMVAAAKQRGEGRLLTLSQYVRSVLHNGLGEHSAALAAAKASIAHQDLAIYGWTLPELVEAAVRAGDDEAAQDARGRLAERADAAGTEWARGARALGEALAGPQEDAPKRFAEAIERFSADRLALLVARARLLFGEWLAASDQRDSAREQLRTAHEELSAIGAAAFAERAGRALAAVGGSLPRKPGGPRVELTAQEGHIARLAIEGNSNAEIGAAMFLSTRTVEWHLRKIFKKLGIASRQELSTALQTTP